MEDISSFIKNNILKVYARPGKKKTSIIGFDENKKALVIEVGAVPENNKANVELVKFLSKKLKKNVVMKSGFTSREKVLLVG